VAARPLLESVVEAALDTAAFRRIFRAAAIEPTGSSSVAIRRTWASTCLPERSS
jgi:hypothetical protein